MGDGKINNNLLPPNSDANSGFSDVNELRNNDDLRKIADEFAKKDFLTVGKDTQYFPHYELKDSPSSSPEDIADIINRGKIRVGFWSSTAEEFFDYSENAGYAKATPNGDYTNPDKNSKTDSKLKKGYDISNHSVSFYLNKNNHTIQFKRAGLEGFHDITKEDIGELAFDKFYTYLKDQSNKKGYSKLTNSSSGQPFWLAYDAKIENYFEALKNIDAGKMESDGLDITTLVDPAHTKYINYTSVLVTMICLGYLKDATEIDFDTNIVKFANKSQYLKALNSIFQTDTEQTEFQRGGAVTALDSIAYYFHEGSTTDTLDGKEVYINAGWAWSAYEMATGYDLGSITASASTQLPANHPYANMTWGKIEIDLPKEFFEYYPLLISIEDDTQKNEKEISTPAVYTVLDPNDKRMITRHAYKFKHRGASSEMFNFEIPEGYRLPTKQELNKFRTELATFNGRTFENTSDNFVLGRTNSGEYLPVLQVWMMDQRTQIPRALQDTVELNATLTHEEAIFMLNIFKTTGVSPIPSNQTGELELPIQWGAGEVSEREDIYYKRDPETNKIIHNEETGEPEVDHVEKLIQRPYAIRIPTHVLLQAIAEMERLLATAKDGDKFVKKQVDGLEDPVEIEIELLKVMLAFAKALQEGNEEKLNDINKILRSQEYGMIENLQSQKGMLKFNAIFQTIFLLVITSSAALSFQQTRLVTGLMTQKEKRKMFEKMCPDLVAENRNRMEKGLPFTRKVIGRTSEIRTFLTYCARMQARLGSGKATGGSLFGPGGVGKDFIFHGAAITLARGYYPDGSPLEEHIKTSLTRIRIFDPEEIISGSSFLGQKEKKAKILVEQAEKELRIEIRNKIARVPMPMWLTSESGDFVGGTVFITNEFADKMAKGANAQTGDVSVVKDLKGKVGDGLFPHIGVYAEVDARKVTHTADGKIDGQQTRRYRPIFPKGIKDQATQEAAQVVLDEILIQAHDNGWKLPRAKELEGFRRDSLILGGKLPWDEVGDYKPNLPKKWAAIPDDHPIKQRALLIAQDSIAYLPDQGDSSRSWQLADEWLSGTVSNRMAEDNPDPWSEQGLREFLRSRGTAAMGDEIQEIKDSLSAIMQSQNMGMNDLRAELEGTIHEGKLSADQVRRFNMGLQRQQTDLDGTEHINRIRALRFFISELDEREAEHPFSGKKGSDKPITREKLRLLKRKIALIYLMGTDCVTETGELAFDLETLERTRDSRPPAHQRQAKKRRTIGQESCFRTATEHFGETLALDLVEKGFRYDELARPLFNNSNLRDALIDMIDEIERDSSRKIEERIESIDLLRRAFVEPETAQRVVDAYKSEDLQKALEICQSLPDAPPPQKPTKEGSLSYETGLYKQLTSPEKGFSPKEAIAIIHILTESNNVTLKNWLEINLPKIPNDLSKEACLEHIQTVIAQLQESELYRPQLEQLKERISAELQDVETQEKSTQTPEITSNSELTQKLTLLFEIDPSNAEGKKYLRNIESALEYLRFVQPEAANYYETELMRANNPDMAQELIQALMATRDSVRAERAAEHQQRAERQQARTTPEPEPAAQPEPSPPSSPTPNASPEAQAVTELMKKGFSREDAIKLKFLLDMEERVPGESTRNYVENLRARINSCGSLQDRENILEQERATFANHTENRPDFAAFRTNMEAELDTPTPSPAPTPTPPAPARATTASPEALETARSAIAKGMEAQLAADIAFLLHSPEAQADPILKGLADAVRADLAAHDGKITEGTKRRVNSMLPLALEGSSLNYDVQAYRRDVANKFSRRSTSGERGSVSTELIVPFGSTIATTKQRLTGEPIDSRADYARQVAMGNALALAYDMARQADEQGRPLDTAEVLRAYKASTRVHDPEIIRRIETFCTRYNNEAPTHAQQVVGRVRLREFAIDHPDFRKDVSLPEARLGLEAEVLSRLEQTGDPALRNLPRENIQFLTDLALIQWQARQGVNMAQGLSPAEAEAKFNEMRAMLLAAQNQGIMLDVTEDALVHLDAHISEYQTDNSVRLRVVERAPKGLHETLMHHMHGQQVMGHIGMVFWIIGEALITTSLQPNNGFVDFMGNFGHHFVSSGAGLTGFMLLDKIFNTGITLSSEWGTTIFQPMRFGPKITMFVEDCFVSAAKTSVRGVLSGGLVPAAIAMGFIDYYYLNHEQIAELNFYVKTGSPSLQAIKNHAWNMMVTRSIIAQGGGFGVGMAVGGAAFSMAAASTIAAGGVMGTMVCPVVGTFVGLGVGVASAWAINKGIDLFETFDTQAHLQRGLYDINEELKTNANKNPELASKPKTQFRLTPHDDDNWLEQIKSSKNNYGWRQYKEACDLLTTPLNHIKEFLSLIDSSSNYVYQDRLQGLKDLTVYEAFCKLGVTDIKMSLGDFRSETILGLLATAAKFPDDKKILTLSQRQFMQPNPSGLAIFYNIEVNIKEGITAGKYTDNLSVNISEMAALIYQDAVKRYEDKEGAEASWDKRDVSSANVESFLLSQTRAGEPLTFDEDSITRLLFDDRASSFPRTILREILAVIGPPAELDLNTGVQAYDFEYLSADYLTDRTTEGFMQLWFEDTKAKTVIIEHVLNQLKAYQKHYPTFSDLPDDFIVTHYGDVMDQLLEMFDYDQVVIDGSMPEHYITSVDDIPMNSPLIPLVKAYYCSLAKELGIELKDEISYETLAKLIKDTTMRDALEGTAEPHEEIETIMDRWVRSDGAYQKNLSDIIDQALSTESPDVLSIKQIAKSIGIMFQINPNLKERAESEFGVDFDSLFQVVFSEKPDVIMGLVQSEDFIQATEAIKSFNTELGQILPYYQKAVEENDYDRAFTAINIIKELGYTSLASYLERKIKEDPASLSSAIQTDWSVQTDPLVSDAKQLKAWMQTWTETLAGTATADYFRFGPNPGVRAVEDGRIRTMIERNWMSYLEQSGIDLTTQQGKDIANKVMIQAWHRFTGKGGFTHFSHDDMVKLCSSEHLDKLPGLKRNLMQFTSLPVWTACSNYYNEGYHVRWTEERVTPDNYSRQAFENAVKRYASNDYKRSGFDSGEDFEYIYTILATIHMPKAQLSSQTGSTEVEALLKILGKHMPKLAVATANQLYGNDHTTASQATMSPETYTIITRMEVETMLKLLRPRMQKHLLLKDLQEHNEEWLVAMGQLNPNYEDNDVAQSEAQTIMNFKNCFAPQVALVAMANQSNPNNREEMKRAVMETFFNEPMIGYSVDDDVLDNLIYLAALMMDMPEETLALIEEQLYAEDPNITQTVYDAYYQLTEEGNS